MSKNTGGKIKLEFGKKVRFLTLEGFVSDLVYTIDGVSTDSWALAPLRNGDCVISVHHKRVLDVDLHGSAIATFGDKEIVVACPVCRRVEVFQPSQVLLSCCPNVKVVFMSEATKAAQVEEATAFDLNALKAKYEVWTKSGKFTESITMTTVQLVLLEGENPRKMSFNLYNGKLNTGAKESDVRLDEFDTGVPTEGKKAFWYNLDKIKYAAKLEKQGYTKL